MNILAHWAGDGGPGPWIVFFPLFWILVIGGVLFLVRRNVRRGGCPGPARGEAGWTGQREESATGLLGRRFASGEIDEDEYRSRMAVLGDDGSGRKDRQDGKNRRNGAA